jgi:hypothetical protein
LGGWVGLWRALNLAQWLSIGIGMLTAIVTIARALSCIGELLLFKANVTLKTM